MSIDYNPKIWGPKAWFFIETIILSYPDNPTLNDKTTFKNFFNSLAYILPCRKCRYNYKNHIKSYPLNDKILSNKNNLIDWIVKIHNLSMGKKITKKSMLNYYINQYKNTNNNLYIYIYIIIILFFFMQIYKYIF
tara:strand:- start:944 stop:1348 length:405 start_codon:yes stop_codon:yes gene_type:complete